MRVPGFLRGPTRNSSRRTRASRSARHPPPLSPPRPEHQPYIHRLTRLGALAQAEGRSLEFVHAIAPVLWDGSVAGWNEGDHLARAAAVAGFDLAAMDAAVIADADRYERIIAGNEQDHAASGHWGVPTFGFENEPFFGQDRIDL